MPIRKTIIMEAVMCPSTMGHVCSGGDLYHFSVPCGGLGPLVVVGGRIACCPTLSRPKTRSPKIT